MNSYTINYLGFLEPYLTKNDYIKFKEYFSNNSQYMVSFEFDNIIKYIDDRINSFDNVNITLESLKNQNII